MTDRDDGRLPGAAEAMLRDWPVPAYREAQWEGRAEAMLAEARSRADERFPDELLEPPLPAEPGEGSMSARSLAPGRPAPRAAVRLSDRDDRLAVAKQTLSHAVRARHTGELLNQVAAVATTGPRADEEEAEELTEADEIESSRPSGAGVAWHPRRRRQSNAPLIGGSIVGALGFAAATLIYLHAIGNPFPSELAARVGVTLPERVARMPAAAPAPPSSAESPEPERTALPPPPQKVAQAPEPAKSDASPTSGKAVAAAPLKPLVRGKTDGSSKPSEPEKVAVNEEPQPAETSASEPEAAKPEPPKPEAKKPEPETYSDRLPPAQNESRPLEPSTGAAMAAIQSVMPAARSCLAGQSEPVSGTVTFGSDGRVHSVSVSGSSANSTALSCIRVALSGARVSPFAKATFSIPVTVRPP